MNSHKVKTVKGRRHLLLKYAPSKGRYLIATKEIKPGNIVISEESFAAISLQGNSRICSYCFRNTRNVVNCNGCITSRYCSIKCRAAAWKKYHWLECFIGPRLDKMKPQTILALRTLLNAAFHLSNEASSEELTFIAAEISEIEDKLKARNSETTTVDRAYGSDYWSIYHLQTHDHEPTMEAEFQSLYGEIKILTQILLRCFSLYDKLLEFDETNEERKQEDYVLHHFLKSTFKKLTLSSYTKLENFDIRFWKLFLEKSSSVSSEDMLKKSLSEVLHSKPTSVEDLLHMLLARHALQTRTNGQGIFRINETNGQFGMQSLEQQRLATGFFPTLSMMNHSCSPNTSISFDGRNVRVAASKIIKKGDEITHCYGPHFSKHTLEERRIILKSQYFFDCTCKICEEDSNDEEKAIHRLQFHAFKCGTCADPVKRDKDSESSGTCINEMCGKKQRLQKMVGQHTKLKEDYYEAVSCLDDGKTRDALLRFKVSLKSAETFLFHNHIDIAKLNDKIAQCHVILGDYSAAVPFLSRSIAINGMLYGPQSVEVAHEYQKLASLYFNIGKVEQAAKFSRRVLSVYAIHYGLEKSFPPGAEEMRKICSLTK